MTDTKENAANDAAAAASEKKARMMRAISAPDTLPTLPTFNRPPQPAGPVAVPDQASSRADDGSETPSRQPPRPNFRKMLRQGQKQDPIAGKAIREQELVRTSYYLTELELREFKALAARNGHAMSEVIRKAVQDYIAMHNPDFGRR